MSLRKTLLPTFQNVPGSTASGTLSTATCDLPLGKRYHVIWLEIGDNGGAGTNVPAAGSCNVTDGAQSLSGNPSNNYVSASQDEWILNNLVQQIRVVIGGTVQQTYTAFELNRINSLNNPSGGTQYSIKSSGTRGNAAYRVYVPIFFAEPWRDDPEISLTALNAVGIDGFQIQVDFQGGLTSPTITGYYEWDLPTQSTIGAIKKVKRQSLAAVGSQTDFTNISTWTNKSKQDYLTTISLFPTSETTPKYVNKVKFTVDSVDYQDLLTAVENQTILLGRQMSPDTSTTPRFDLVLDYDNPVNQALPLAAANYINVHCEFNSSASGNMIALIQAVGLPE
jgi:hypothetical protein